MRPTLPTGTVTFLFSDIEGSTALLHELGDGYDRVLGEHRRILRSAFERHGGIEVDTQGDGFFVAFARASDAVAAAKDAQAALADTPVRVRMGVHTGEPRVGEEGYVGIDVHRAARIAAAGHGGQVLLSQSARDLLDSSFELLELGRHRLKDLSEPQLLYQLGTESFPPLRTLAQTNLPVTATPFLGRERELAEVVDLLRSTRLLTLTGPGGSGKTRLGLQAAAEAADGFPGGVWWVSLDAVRDPALVLDAVSQALAAKSELREHIGSTELLLFLDNFEHVLDAASDLGALLVGCSNLRAIVTSREPLRLAAEQEYPVPPLAPQEAIAFFTARARAAKPDFEPSAAVADLCRRLDDLPLALELAAARVKVLGVEQILARLEQALPLLTGGPRDAPERQRTLAATIAWSYEMLSEPERELFARMSVFAGGATLEAAEEVADADLDTLASLVDKSLVRQSHDRFWMLQTIREFACERLSELDPDGVVPRRHLEYFLAHAEDYYGALFETATEAQLNWFEREHANLRVALDEAFVGIGDHELAGRLAFACTKYWLNRGLWAEGRRRIDAALEHNREAPPDLRVRLLWLATEFAVLTGDGTRAKRLGEAATDLAESVGDPTLRFAAAGALGFAEYHLGNVARAYELMESLRPYVEASGNDELLAMLMNQLGSVALHERDLAAARRHFETTVEVARRTGVDPIIANSLNDLGFLAIAEGNVAGAASEFQESLSILRRARFDHLTLWAIEGLAAVAVERREPRVAVALYAVVQRVRDEMGPGAAYSIGDEVRERALAHARSALAADEFAAAWAAGERMSLEDAADAAARVA